jgi:hypothetical protein
MSKGVLAITGSKREQRRGLAYGSAYMADLLSSAVLRFSLPFTARLYVDAADALGKQQPLDAVDVRRPLGD